MTQQIKRTTRSTKGRLVLVGVLSFAIATLASLTFSGMLFGAGAPPNPTITSGPANPTNQTSATFTFTDSQSGVGFLCQLDGSAFAPCTSPTTYAGPLAPGAHQFRVEVTAGGTSGATAWNWTIDTTPPPAPQITAQPADPTNATSASFSFKDSEGGVTFFCKLDGSSYTACTTPQSYSGLAEGTHTFSVEAKDPAGNIGTATSVTWHVDLTPPAAPTITASPPSQTNSTSASFSFTDEAGATFLCSLDGAAFAACASPKSYTNLSNGTHVFQVEAKDTAGNIGSPASFSWFVGPTPPTITSNPPNPSNSTSATFAFTSPDSGVSFLCKLDGAAYAACAGPKTYTGLADGAHIFLVEGKVGSSIGMPTSYTWTVDTTPPPAPALAAKPANPTNQTSAGFSFTDGDATASFLCKLDGGSFVACSSPQSYSSLAPGSHTFAVEAKDPAANVGAATTYIWTIDVTPPPSPSITSGPAALTTSTSAAFAFADTEAGVTYVCAVDAGFTACTSPKNYSGLADGAHTFYVEAVDAAGNASSPASYTWTVDTTPPPAPLLNSTPANPTNQTSASFSFTDADASSSFLCSLDGSTFAACASPKSYAGLAAGNRTFKVEAKDPAGNVGQATTFTWTIDLTPPPAPTINSAPADPTNSTSATFNFGDAKGGVVFLCSLDGSSFAACPDPQTYPGPLAEGLHTFKIEAKDPAGNVGAATTYTWSVDLTAPSVVSITRDDPSPTTLASVSWTVTFSEPVKNVDAHDFVLVVSGLGGGPKITSVTPSPGTFSTGWILTASSGSGMGTLGLNLVDDDSIKDAATNPLGGVGAGNGNFTGQVYAIDHIAPPMPTYATSPPDPSFSTKATFAWTDSATDVVDYQCSVDDGPFYDCTSPQVLTGLSTGDREFEVYAVDAAGNQSPDNEFHWTIKASTGQPLTITGDAPGLLYPGGAVRTFATMFTNPNTSSVTVTSLTTTVVAASLPAGCSTTDFHITPSNVSTAHPITVPANDSVTLPDPVHAPGVTAPTIQMNDSGAPQDACAGVMLTVSYGGSNTGHATVGSVVSPFTVTVGQAIGGPLMPTARNSANRVVLSVPVTVKNTDPGFENLRQLLYKITPGWSVTLAGHPACTASDFSIGGEPVGASHTVVYDDDLPPGGQVLHSVTVQMIDNRQNQDACRNVHVSLTVVAS